METIIDFITSFILGLLGLLPVFILRFKFKLKFNKVKSALLMIPIAMILLFIIYAITYAIGYQIQNYSIITLSIIGWGTYQLLFDENDFEAMFKKDKEIKPDTEFKKTTNDKKEKKFYIIISIIILNFLFSILLSGYCLTKINSIEKSYKKFIKRYDTDSYYQSRSDYLFDLILYENGLKNIKPTKPLYIDLYEMKYNISDEEKFKL